MSGIKRDSFDLYQGYVNGGNPPVGFIGIKWSNIVTGTFGTVFTSPGISGSGETGGIAGRTGPQSMGFDPSTGLAYLTLTVPNYSNYFVGFAKFITSLGNSTLNLRFNARGLGGPPAPIFSVAANGTGGFDYFIYPAGVLTYGGSTANSLYAANEWFYLEVNCNPTGTNINIEIRVNGIVAVNGTVGGPTNDISSIDVGAIGGFGPKLYIDDFYLNDDQDDPFLTSLSLSTPSIVKGFMGDVKVVAALPVSDGSHLDWTPLSGMTHYTEVNAQYENNGVTYVSSVTPGNIDSYNFPALSLPTGGTLIDVQAIAVVEKTDAGSRTLCHVTVEGGTTTESPTNVATPITETFQCATYIWTIDPETAVPWTVTSFNASQFGPELNS